MEIYSITNKDIEFINILIELDTSIESIYEKLYCLEIKGKKNTKEYQELLNLLKEDIFMEKYIYDNEKLTYTRCKSLIKYIMFYKLPDDFLTDEESISLQSTQIYDNKVLRRILKNLRIKLFFDINCAKNIVPKELINSLKEVDEEAEFLAFDGIHSGIEITKAIEKDLYNSYLYFLNTFININRETAIEKDLIHSKYYLSFINSLIEDDMLSSNFDISDKLYIGSRLIADLNDINLNTYTELRNSQGKSSSITQLSQLIDIHDFEYCSNLGIVNSILCQCMLRASLLLMDDEAIMDVNSDLHDFLESDEYLENHSSDHISQDIVIDCFKKVKKDRNVTNTLSLRLK